MLVNIFLMLTNESYCKVLPITFVNLSHLYC